MQLSGNDGCNKRPANKKGCMVMEKLEKVELIREKTGVSYDDANAALEASNGDVLDAIIFLERVGKAQPQTASYTTTGTDTTFGAPVSPEMVEAQNAYQQQSKRSKFGEYMKRIGEEIKRLVRASIDITFVIERHGNRVIALPVLVLVLAVFLWWAAIPLLIVGLFFDCHYHFEGIKRVTVDVNDVMDKASEVADSIKRDVTGTTDNDGTNGNE